MIPQTFPEIQSERMTLFGDLIEPLKIGPHPRRLGSMIEDEEIWTKDLLNGNKLCILFDPDTAEASMGEGDVFIMHGDGSRHRQEPYCSPEELAEALARVYREETGQA